MKWLVEYLSFLIQFPLCSILPFLALIATVPGTPDSNQAPDQEEGREQLAPPAVENRINFNFGVLVYCNFEYLNIFEYWSISILYFWTTGVYMNTGVVTYDGAIVIYWKWRKSWKIDSFKTKVGPIFLTVKILSAIRLDLKFLFFHWQWVKSIMPSWWYKW